MFKRTRISVGVLAALGGGLALSQLAQAQDAQRIEITGSRIKSLSADSSSPLQVYNAEDIQSSGVINLQDLLQTNPTMSTPGISRTNSNFATSSSGVSTVDLRNLGTSRTLVLVNGKRFVSGVPGESAVDLNAIPTDFIERIDLLTGGASSTYGSDAVAGVINIIYKKNFQGFLVDASKGISSKGDNKESKLSLTWGVNAPDNRGNLMVHLGYSGQGAVYSKDRDISAVDQISTGAAITGDPADIFSATRPFYSSFAPQGRFFPNPNSTAGSKTFDANGNLISFSTNGPAGDGVGATGFNRSAYRTIAVPTDRYLLATKGEYAISDQHSAYMEGTYAQTKVVSQLEPFPLSSNGTSSIFPNAGGSVPAATLVNGVVVPNPLIPTAFYNLLTTKDANGIPQYQFTRRLTEIGDRGSNVERNTFRLVTGVKGTIFGSWDYDTYVGYGSTSEAQTSGGQVNVANFRNALSAIPDANGNPICADATARAQGCVPINIFGYNSISPAAAAYVSAPQSLTTSVTQTYYGASVSGEPLALPAGRLGVAAGLEYRAETSRSEFDALTQAGLNAGNAQPATKGSFNVSEGYLELRAPLLKDLPFAQSLVATGAVRGAKYSTVGNVTSYNAGLEFSPSRDFKFRGTTAQSTRAPNINELYQPPQQTFPTGLSDPCVGVTATTPGALAVNCRADPGVAANIATNGAFTLNQSDIQGVSGFDRGNPTVKQEKGKSLTLGLVVTPTIEALKRFSFTVDYFDIKIADAIVSTPRQFILQQCYSGDASFCQFIKRRPTVAGGNSAGSLAFIDSAVTNSGELATRGVDLTASYAGNVGPGALSARVAYTRLLDGYNIPLPGADKDYFAGEVGAARDRLVLTLGYKMGPFGITSQTSYIGKSSLDDQFLASNFDLPRDSIQVSSKTYNDFQFTYEWKKVQMYVGIKNAFDVKPPPIISGLPGDITGTETAADVYDAIGRRYYAGVRMSF
jgi:outer membrane receptor protein involved in Fe transport